MAFQGIFRRHNKFVVVRTIHLTANDTLEVGTVIDMKRGNVKWFQLRLWFRRRKIGTLDSPWANAMLKGHRRPERGSIGKQPDIDTTSDIQNLAKTLSAVAEQKGEELIGLETEEGAKELSGVKVDKPADSTVEPSNEQEPASTEPETDEQKDRRRKDAKNKREREKRAAIAASKAAK